MHLSKISFPPHSAPLVGAAVGALLGYKAGVRAGKPFNLDFVAGGAALGFIGGLVTWVISPTRDGTGSNVRKATDPESAKMETVWERSPDAYVVDDLSKRRYEEPAVLRAPHYVERLLAVLSLVLVCVPPLGLMFGIGAIISSWHARGWAWVVGWIGVLLSLATLVSWVVVAATN